MMMSKGCIGALSAFVAVALLAGCGDATGPYDRVAGDYSLILVNGDTPPVVIVDSIVRDTVKNEDEHLVVEIVDGNLDLDEVGTFGWTVWFDLTIDGNTLDNQPVSVPSGRYEIDGGSIYLDPTPDSLPSDTAALDGRTITFSENHPEYGDFELTFEKESSDDNDSY